jgi:nitroreductase
MGYAPLWRAMGKIYKKGKDLLFFYAPAVMVIHLNPEKASPFGADAGLAAMQMVLMAEALGLGTCFSGFLTSASNSSPELKQMLCIPAEHDVLLSFTIGHPDIRFPRTVSRHPANVTYL